MGHYADASLPSWVMSGNPQSEHSESAFTRKQTQEQTSVHVGLGPEAEIGVNDDRPYCGELSRLRRAIEKGKHSSRVTQGHLHLLGLVRKQNTTEGQTDQKHRNKCQTQGTAVLRRLGLVPHSCLSKSSRSLSSILWTLRLSVL